MDTQHRASTSWKLAESISVSWALWLAMLGEMTALVGGEQVLVSSDTDSGPGGCEEADM